MHVHMNTWAFATSIIRRRAVDKLLIWEKYALKELKICNKNYNITNSYITTDELIAYKPIMKFIYRQLQISTNIYHCSWRNDNIQL